MIKKYITLAALFTAGTALANAAKEWVDAEKDVTITTTFGNTNGVSDINSIERNVTVSGAFNNGVFIANLTSDKALIGAGTAAKNSSIVPNIDVATSGSWTLNFTYNFGTLVSQVQQLAISTGGTPHKLEIDSVSLKLGATDTSGNFVTPDKNNSYDFTVVFTPGDGLSTTNRLENHSVTATGQNHLLQGTGPQENPIKIEFSKSQLQSLVPTASTGLKLTVGGAQSSTAGSIGIQSITFNAKVFKQVEVSDSNVPEPSAFGLLAGLGALALVSARRRRK